MVLFAAFRRFADPHDLSSKKPPTPQWLQTVKCRPCSGERKKHGDFHDIGEPAEFPEYPYAVSPAIYKVGATHD
jgi:hypothetical protein